MLSSGYHSYKSPALFESKLCTVLSDFGAYKVSTFAPGLLHLLNNDHLAWTSIVSNTFFDFLSPDPNNNTMKLHSMIWDAGVVDL